MKTSIEKLASADWERIEQDVVSRLRLIKAMCQGIERDELSDKIANDIVLPALSLIAEFCACVEVFEEP